MLIPLIIFIFYNVKIVFKKWEIKRVVVVVVVVRNVTSIFGLSSAFANRTETGFLSNDVRCFVCYIKQRLIGQTDITGMFTIYFRQLSNLYWLQCAQGSNSSSSEAIRCVSYKYSQ